MAYQNSFLADLLARRLEMEHTPETTRFVELVGGTVLEPTAFEPDARTHRNDYYYNAVLNILFKRIVTKREANQIMNAHWSRVSN